MSDDFRVSSITIKDLEFAVARKKSQGLIGIMGLGFDTGVSVASEGGKPYKSIIDSMVGQDLINSHSYSLWLNDLGKSEGPGALPSDCNLQELISSDNFREWDG
jgi:hypothetical protein